MMWSVGVVEVLVTRVGLFMTATSPYSGVVFTTFFILYQVFWICICHFHWKSVIKRLADSTASTMSGQKILGVYRRVLRIDRRMVRRVLRVDKRVDK